MHFSLFAEEEFLKTSPPGIRATGWRQREGKLFELGQFESMKNENYTKNISASPLYDFSLFSLSVELFH